MPTFTEKWAMFMTIKEKDIILETGSGWWVWRDTKGQSYTVFMPKGTHSETDSSYPLTEDGLSLALIRCKYMNKRKAEKKGLQGNASL